MGIYVEAKVYFIHEVSPERRDRRYNSQYIYLIRSLVEEK